MAQSLIFEAGSTNHFETFTVNGTAGNLIVIDSSDSATPHYLINDTSLGIICEFLDISHSHATPNAKWNANNSIDRIDNTGWFDGPDTPTTGIRGYAGRSKLFKLTYNGYNRKKKGYSDSF